MVYFTGSTAGSSGSATTLTFSVTGGLVSLPGQDAYSYAAAPLLGFVVGTYADGDFWYVPTGITGTSDITFSLEDYTLDALDVEYLQGTKSRWFRWVGSVPGNLAIAAETTAAAGDEPLIEVWDGTVFDEPFQNWVYRPFPTLNGNMDVFDGSFMDIGAVTSNVPLMIRVAAIDEVGDYDTTLYWQFTAGGSSLYFDNLTPIVNRTPISIRVSVANALPYETINFSLIGSGSCGSLVADSGGVISNASVVLPAISAGTHTVRATGGTTNQTYDDSVQVRYASRVVPEAPDEDVPPVSVEQTGPVRYWVLQDPVEDRLDQYIFPINPSTMSSPYAPRNVDFAHTTGKDGQAHIWEGGVRAHTWSFSGYLDTEEFMDALVDYGDLNGRFYLIDHHNQAWVVTFAQVDLQPKRVIGKPYAHNYTVQALIYAGPEVLT